MGQKMEHDVAVWRKEGKDAWLYSRAIPNPYPENSFQAYCWNAGYQQDVKNAEQLYSEWKKKTGILVK